MTEALPLRIFLASASDLDEERAGIHTCVEEHNNRIKGDSYNRYEIVDGSQVRGTARRPQEAINELIAECHFMIVLFKRAWGTTPGSPWGYTSGTEEELFTGLLALGQAEQPMRDLWIVFVENSRPDSRINRLRQQIISQNSALFESINDLHALKSKLAARLLSWEGLANAKTPRNVKLLPSSGKDVLQAARLRLDGEKLISLGQSELGREHLEEAARLGGPDEWLAYGTALRRSGRLNDAYMETQKAIEYFSENGHLYSALAAQAFSAQAKVLQLQGKHNNVIGLLSHALTLLTAQNDHTQKVRCEIYDALGHAHRKVNDIYNARRSFEEALTIRRKYNFDIGIYQSLVNLARLSIAENDLAAAAGYADEAIQALRQTPPTGLHANAEVLKAQILLRQGRALEGIGHAERALANNRQLDNKQGEAIALLALTQCHRAAGQNDKAKVYGHKCLILNRSINNSHGVDKAQWQLDRLSIATT